MLTPKEKFERRRNRARARVATTRGGDRLRLSVYRSNMHIYAQLVDDQNRATRVSASTLEKELRTALKSGGNKDAAAKVGALIAQRAVKAGIKKVVFDRGAYLYHGRIKALAEAARENGLEF
ncbi:MAG: 50S ribosomal protein L18 [Alphaproteobacteria bacterium]|nr:50S ribosomal protein L18 [Alphaproteobacteria bacterium]